LCSSPRPPRFRLRTELDAAPSATEDETEATADEAAQRERDAAAAAEKAVLDAERARLHAEQAAAAAKAARKFREEEAAMKDPMARKSSSILATLRTQDGPATRRPFG
jgi:hypothetical protein